MQIKKVTKYEVNGCTFDCFIDAQNYVASQATLTKLKAFIKKHSRCTWVNDTSADPYIDLIDLPDYLYNFREELLTILAEGGVMGVLASGQNRP